MKSIDYFRIWDSAHGLDFDEIYEIVSQEPTTEKSWGGYIYRYWFELLTADPMEDLLQLDIPLLFGIGENDELIESVNFLREQFAKHGKHNLTTIVYPGCNHALEDSDGKSHRKEFLQDMHNSLHERRSSNIMRLDRQGKARYPIVRNTFSSFSPRNCSSALRLQSAWPRRKRASRWNFRWNGPTAGIG